jgi:hypothetical protein
MGILPTPSERAIIFYYLCTVYKQLKKNIIMAVRKTSGPGDGMTLKTKSATQVTTRPSRSEIISAPKRKMVKPEAKPIFKGTVSAQGKLSGKVGNQLRNTPIKKVVTAIANVPAKAVFKREQKLAAGYKRADQTMGGSGVKMMNKKEGLAALKSEKGVLKSIKKDKTVDVKSALKDVKLAERYQKRAIKGKIGKYTK